MAELWGGIEQFFGIVLAGIYKLIPSYGVAIILLTLLSRLVIMPLGIKQIRSMQQMQKLQPKIKELQKKYKGDRQKLNEEMMKLYKEHGANPLGGCFPLIAQFPVFIALYAVIRSALPGFAAPPAEFKIPAIPAKAFCHPTGDPSLKGPEPIEIICELPDGATPLRIPIAGWAPIPKDAKLAPVSALTHCARAKSSDGIEGFKCDSIFGAGHLPKDSRLIKDLVEGRTKFLGMHLACSPNDAGNVIGIKKCAPKSEKPGGADLIGYYLLVVLMAGSTYIQQRQMSKRATGQQAQQMKMMGVMMPVLFGWLSLTFPAALSLYWVTGNIWTIAQQKIIFGRDEAPAGAAPVQPVKNPRQKPKPPKPPQKKGKR